MLALPKSTVYELVRRGELPLRSAWPRCASPVRTSKRAFAGLT